jgi:hypothetical protein
MQGLVPHGWTEPILINQTNATVTVKYQVFAGAEDEYGNSRYTNYEEDYAVLLSWGATGIDYGLNRNVLTTQATLYFQENIVIPESSEIIINGETYLMDGEQVRWNIPSGWTLQAGSVVQVKKSEG